MNLTAEQLANKAIIEQIAAIVGIDPAWALGVAMTESSLGLHQLSPTGARGIFQMTSIAMKDLLLEMAQNDDDMVDILCGIAFLWVLYKRHGNMADATMKYCDPNDRHFYLARVQKFMEQFRKEDL